MKLETCTNSVYACKVVYDIVEDYGHWWGTDLIGEIIKWSNLWYILN